ESDPGVNPCVRFTAWLLTGIRIRMHVIGERAGLTTDAFDPVLDLLRCRALRVVLISVGVRIDAVGVLSGSAVDAVDPCLDLSLSRSGIRLTEQVVLATVVGSEESVD